MAFPNPADYNLYISDDLGVTWVPVVGAISWDFTSEPEGETRIVYMGGGELVRTSTKRNKSLAVGGLWDPLDPGQVQLRTAADTGTKRYVAMVHDDTAATEAGRYAGASIGAYGDNVDVDSDDQPRATISISIQGAITAFAGGLPVGPLPAL